jgi:ATP-binding cassette subfamily B multidrug efflux pump
MKIILRLLVFARRRWAGLLIGFICITVSTVGGMVIPRALGIGIDTALSSGSKNYILVLAAVIMGTTVLRSAARFGDTYVTQLVSQQASYDIRNALYDHLQRLSFIYYDKAQTGQIMSRATVDIEAARMFLSAGLLNLIQIFLVVFGVGYLLLSLNWKLALLTLAFMPLIFWQTLYVSNRLQPVWLKVQQLMGALGNTLQESLFGIKVVKAFSLQERENRKFNDDASKLYDQQVGAARLQAIYTPLMTLLLGIPTVVVLWYGGHQGRHPVHPVPGHDGRLREPARHAGHHDFPHHLSWGTHFRNTGHRIGGPGKTGRVRDEHGRGGGVVQACHLRL